MGDDIQTRMLGSLYACLVPIARILLRYGITYRQFAEIGKAAFVREAFAETDVRGRRANGSRVSVRTGLSRKEVRRLREKVLKVPGALEDSHADHSGPPARVLHAWHSDPRFLDAEGLPRAIKLDGDESSFSTLVRAVAGDVPSGAVRAELKRAGAIAETSDGRLLPTKRYYVPGNVDEKAITVMSGMLFPLAAGIDHNSRPGRTADGFIQRFAFSDGLSAESVPAFRAWSRREAVRFIESVDDWIAENESPGKSASHRHGGLPVISGVGVFYYEGPVAEYVISE
jgi:hypothetical protein